MKTLKSGQTGNKTVPQRGWWKEFEQRLCLSKTKNSPLVQLFGEFCLMHTFLNYDFLPFSEILQKHLNLVRKSKLQLLFVLQIVCDKCFYSRPLYQRASRHEIISNYSMTFAKKRRIIFVTNVFCSPLASNKKRSSWSLPV